MHVTLATESQRHRAAEDAQTDFILGNPEAELRHLKKIQMNVSDVCGRIGHGPSDWFLPRWDGNAVCDSGYDAGSALADGLIVIRDPGVEVVRGHFSVQNFAPLEVTYHHVTCEIHDRQVVATTSVDSGVL